MKEFKATLHAYEIVTPPRCKLERLEPVTEEITLQLHYAESAPVAMRVNGPLEYAGKDGNAYTWRDESLELLALDGGLWRRVDTSRYHDGAWTVDDLARLIDDHNVLTRWPWQYSSDEEPPRGLLVPGLPVRAARNHGKGRAQDRTARRFRRSVRDRRRRRRCALSVGIAELRQAPRARRPLKERRPRACDPRPQLNTLDELNDDAPAVNHECVSIVKLAS